MHEVLFVFTEPCMYEGFLADIGRIKKINFLAFGVFKSNKHYLNSILSFIYYE